MKHQKSEEAWTAAPRGSAEAPLHVTEEKYRLLFESRDEGFCVVEALFDDRGRPVDYRFLEGNPASVPIVRDGGWRFNLTVCTPWRGIGATTRSPCCAS